MVDRAATGSRSDATSGQAHAAVRAAPLAHLGPGLLAVLLVAVLLAAMVIYARMLELRYVYALAPLFFTQKMQGVALQQAALEQPDLLLLYGSSELQTGAEYQKSEFPYHLFATRPTGFDVFPVGQNNMTSLTILQRLAALGPELRGRQVVISLSPGFFINFSMVAPSAYAFNFSHLQADELVYNSPLSLQLKQAIARRMLQYPKTLDHAPLLRFSLEQLADGSPMSRWRYYAVWPIGELETLVLQLQDHWEMLSLISCPANLTSSTQHLPIEGKSCGPALNPTIQPVPATINWPAFEQHAQQVVRKNNTSNPFGFDDYNWRHRIHSWAATAENARSDKQFRQSLDQGVEWVDMDLMLRTLQELGARPLVLSMPMPGTFYQYLGVSAQSRMLYYQKFRTLASRYPVAERDFADHDLDTDFILDASNHLSAKGWAYYDQVLDAFYHDRLPALAADQKELAFYANR